MTQAIRYCDFCKTKTDYNISSIMGYGICDDCYPKVKAVLKQLTDGVNGKK